MYRIDNATSAQTLPSPTSPGPHPNSYFTKGNPALNTQATIVDDEWLNMVQEEIANAITGGGVGAAGGAADLNKGNRQQLLGAMRQSALVHIGDTPPTGVLPGALWWDSQGGELYIYYQDADNSSQWVQINSPTP